MEYFKIEVDGKQFIESYLVYIIEVDSSKYGKYYYVGQTGDRNHFTARPAFRRLSGHLSDQGHSTDNQLYRSIVRKILRHNITEKGPFDKDLKQKVSVFLRNAKISMHAFQIKEFEKKSLDEHKSNRQFVEAIEKNIISTLVDIFGIDFMLNKNISKMKAVSDEEIHHIVNKIVNQVFS